MLALTLAIGASYFMPMHLVADRTHWYLIVITVELCICALALALKTRASAIVAIICLMLEFNHVTGWVFGGHKPDSPYYVVVNFLEYLEIFALSLFSEPVLNKIKGPLCTVLKHLRGYLVER